MTTNNPQITIAGKAFMKGAFAHVCGDPRTPPPAYNAKERDSFFKGYDRSAAGCHPGHHQTGNTIMTTTTETDLTIDGKPSVGKYLSAGKSMADFDADMAKWREANPGRTKFRVINPKAVGGPSVRKLRR